MSEAAVQELIDAIDSVKEKRAFTTVKLDDVDSLCEQVRSSGEQAIAHLHQEFSELKVSLNAVLSVREAELEKEVQEAMCLDLTALGEIEDELQEYLSPAVDLMEKGKKLLMGDHDSNLEEMMKFAKEAKSLNLDSSQVAVPTAQDVACLHIEIPSGLVEEVERQLKDFGEVFSRPPVQISSVEERPGGLMVKWSETEEDALELDEFYLQFCHGIAQGNDDESVLFRDAYKGSGSSTIVRPLKCGLNYSLRVCGRTSGAPTWSPWSVPRFVTTSIPPYKWSSSDLGLDSRLSDEDQVCEKVTDQQTQSPWISSGPCLLCGHSLTFQVRECGRIHPSDCVFLSPDPVTATLDVANNGCLLVTAQGKIYMQGEEKTIKFPALTRNSVVSFDTEVLGAGKVRVSIEVDDKYTAGFDWTLDKSKTQDGTLSPSATGSSVDKADNDTYLYFGAQFLYSGWKVMVE